MDDGTKCDDDDGTGIVQPSAWLASEASVRESARPPCADKGSERGWRAPPVAVPLLAACWKQKSS
jgi:hypothetical protein